MPLRFDAHALARVPILRSLSISSVIAWFATVAMLGALLGAGQDALSVRVAAVCGWAIVLFATRALPEVVTALVTILALLAINAAPAEVIFSGFTTGGLWLTFSGLIIGTAISTSGLGRQLALRIFARTGASYRRAVILLSLSGVGLGLLVPSTIPRVIVIVPIALSLAEAMGYRAGSRGHIGLTITAATMTLLPTYTILTANLPTIVQFGAIEALFGFHVSYADYFVQQLPVNLVRFGVLLALLLPFASDAAQPPDHLPRTEPLNPAQWRLLAVLICAIAFWASDFWHAIPPAWIGLTAAAVVLMPAAGMLDRLAMKTSVDLSPMIFLAGVFAISSVAAHTGLAEDLAGAVIPKLGLARSESLWGDLQNLYAITGFSVFISHLTTAPAAPVLLAPLAQSMAEAVGWGTKTVAMAQMVGISTPLLPYQAPPLIVAIGLAQIPVRPLMRICAVLALAIAAFGVPLCYLWWRLLGVI